MSQDQYYAISVDRSTKLVRLTLRGNWTKEILEDFHKARAAMVQSLGPDMNNYSCISIISEYAVLPADLAEMDRLSIAEMPFKPKRLAFVVGSAIKRLQAHRVADQNLMRSFPTEAEALDWLLSDEPS